MSKSKRVKLEVCPNKKQGKNWTGHKWKITQDGALLFLHTTQETAISAARIVVDTLLMRGLTVTLKIKRPDGTIRDERTYPRSSDPKRTKG